MMRYMVCGAAGAALLGGLVVDSIGAATSDERAGFSVQQLNNTEIEVFPNDPKRLYVVASPSPASGDVTFRLRVDSGVSLVLADDTGQNVWADLEDPFAIYEIVYTDLDTATPRVKVQVLTYDKEDGEVDVDVAQNETDANKLGFWDPTINQDPHIEVVGGQDVSSINFSMKGVTISFTVKVP